MRWPLALRQLLVQRRRAPGQRGRARADASKICSALAAKPQVVAIGETGLDYYRLGERSVADMEWQRQRFRVHIRAARATGLPLVIHTRSASRRHARRCCARRARAAAGGGVFHCFTETAEVARAALDLGFYISFSGILTFKTAADLREVAAFVPLDRCLIETDSPYLAPVPYRGKVNTPAYVPWVARQLAEIKKLDGRSGGGRDEPQISSASSARTMT